MTKYEQQFYEVIISELPKIRNVSYSWCSTDSEAGAGPVRGPRPRPINRENAYKTYSFLDISGFGRIPGTPGFPSENSKLKSIGRRPAGLGPL